MTSQQKAESLLEYIKENPEQRFWQALLSWSGFPYIVISQVPPYEIGDQRLEDTFYLKD